MTTLPATTLSQQLFKGGTVRRNFQLNRVLILPPHFTSWWQLSNWRSLFSRH